MSRITSTRDKTNAVYLIIANFIWLVLALQNTWFVIPFAICFMFTVVWAIAKTREDTAHE